MPHGIIFKHKSLDSHYSRSIRKQILFKSDAIFTSSLDTRKWALGLKDIDKETFINEFGSLKPCIHGSDSHSYEDLCKPSHERYCWIKADTTFEGLRQILFEPADRVLISKYNPEPHKSIYTINSMRYDHKLINPELSLHKTNISLNPNLVAITGGKGCGKTAFLDFISHCFKDRSSNGEEIDENSFIKRIEDEAPDFNWLISFIEESISPFRKRLDDGLFFGESRIEYLPQGKIEKISSNSKDVSDRILNIVFSNEEVVEAGYKKQHTECESKIESINEDILGLIRELVDLEDATTDEKSKQYSKLLALKEGEIKKKQHEIVVFNEYAGKEGLDTEEVDNLIQEEIEIGNRLKIHERLNQRIVMLKTLWSKYIKEINNIINNINEDLRELGIETELTTYIESYSSNELETTERQLQLESLELSKNLSSIKSKIKAVQDVVKRKAVLVRSIEEHKKELGSIKDKQKRIDNIRQSIPDKKEILYNKYDELISTYRQWMNSYKEMTSTFTKGKQDILKGIEFRSAIHINFISIREKLIEFVDQRRVNIDDEMSVIKEVLSKLNETDIEIGQIIKEYFRNAEKYSNIMRPNASKFDFYYWLFGDYFNLRIYIRFHNISMNKLSMGQRGTVLLKLILAEGDWPVLIDQPEENLDNRYIFTDLVNALREAKKVRQIIIATNNANMVITTDSEQVIIANKEENRISYSVGTIEDLELRNDLIPVLEGGEEAFIMRERRYGIG